MGSANSGVNSFLISIFFFHFHLMRVSFSSLQSLGKYDVYYLHKLNVLKFASHALYTLSGTFIVRKRDNDINVENAIKWFGAFFFSSLLYLNGQRKAVAITYTHTHILYLISSCTNSNTHNNKYIPK